MKGSGSCPSGSGCPLTRIGQAMIAVSMGGLTVYVARQMFDVMKLRKELFESEEFKAKPEVRSGPCVERVPISARPPPPTPGPCTVPSDV